MVTVTGMFPHTDDGNGDSDGGDDGHIFKNKQIFETGFI